MMQRWPLPSSLFRWVQYSPLGPRIGPHHPTVIGAKAGVEHLIFANPVNALVGSPPARGLPLIETTTERSGIYQIYCSAARSAVAHMIAAGQSERERERETESWI